MNTLPIAADTLDAAVRVPQQADMLADVSAFCPQPYPPDDGSKAYQLIMAARLAIDEGKDPEAINICRDAIAAAQDAQATKMQIWALCMMGTTLAAVGLHKEALGTSTTALDMAQAQKDTILEARALIAIAFVALETRDEDQAEEVLERSLICARRGRSALDAFWALNNLSHIHGERAQRLKHDVAAQQTSLQALCETAAAALAMSRRTQSWAHRCYALLNLANASLLKGHFRQARARIIRYSRIARLNNSARLMAFANIDFAQLDRSEGKLDRAIATLGAPAHLEELCQSDDLKLRTQELLAEFLHQQKDFEQAFHHLQCARDIERRMQVFRAERQVAALTTKLEIEEARAEAERLKLAAAALELRNRRLERDRAVLQRDASRDPLTQLGNRRAADAALAEQLQIARDRLGPLCLAYLDVDHFKLVNDRLGHQMGDRVLTAIADVLRAQLRGKDDVFRFGGEEFVIILPDRPLAAGRDICDRLRRSIAAHDWAALHPDLSVTASFGVACLRYETDSGDLLARADAALYRAKNSGRNCVVVG